MTGGQPKKAPNTLELLSAFSALSKFLALPCSSINPARLATPSKVPAVSNKFTNKNAMITLIMATSNAPTISNCIKVGAKLGGAAIRPLNSTSPMAIAILVTLRIPIIMAPGTRRIERIAILKKLKPASKVWGCVKSPRDRKVAPLATIIPPLLRPMNPINKPTPAPIAIRKLREILSNIHLRRRVTLMITKIIPAKKTAPSAICQL